MVSDPIGRRGGGGGGWFLTEVPPRDLPRRLFPRARSVLYNAMWFNQAPGGLANPHSLRPDPSPSLEATGRRPTPSRPPQANPRSNAIQTYSPTHWQTLSLGTPKGRGGGLVQRAPSWPRSVLDNWTQTQSCRRPPTLDLGKISKDRSLSIFLFPFGSGSTFLSLRGPNEPFPRPDSGTWPPEPGRIHSRTSPRGPGHLPGGGGGARTFRSVGTVPSSNHRTSFPHRQ